MKLRAKFYIGLLPLLLLLLFVGAMGIRVCLDIALSSSKKIENSYAVMIATHDMREAANGASRAIQRALDGYPLEARPVYEKNRGAFKRVLMDQSFKAANSDAVRTKAIKRVSDAFAQLEDCGNAVFFSNDIEEQQQHFVSVESAYFATLSALDGLLDADSQAMQTEAGRVRTIAMASTRLLIIAIAIGIALSLLLAFVLGRMFVRPITKLTASARTLGEGNFEHDVPVSTKDELGTLGSTFNIMAAKLRDYREAMNERVVRAQRTMEATMTSTPDPLFIVARDGRCDIRNPAAALLAQAPEFAQGPSGFPDTLLEKVRQVIDTQEHYLPTSYDQVIMVFADRDERFYLPRILSIADKLSSTGSAALLLQDVTKFRLMDDAKNNLVGTVSHELKTPLTSLRMAVYLLLEENAAANGAGPGALTQPQRELLETARDNADRLLRILNDILDLARIESGATALSRRPVNVREMLAEMAGEMNVITTNTGQHIEVRVADKVDTAFVDPERLRHVFVNLLGNAAKYSPEGGRIELYAQPELDGAIRFGVRDEGVGIAEENVPRVFDKFFRVHGQRLKGAGLGLAIAREIVLAHGGTIACSSKLGKGSDFYFVIPGNIPDA